MTTFAVATPHALILTVSHGLLFCQPLICAGTDAAVSTRRISPGPDPSPDTVFLHGLLHERARPTYRPFTAPSRSCAHEPSAIPADAGGFTAGGANSVSSARHFVPMRAEPMKISRSECGDPVCSPDPASLLRLSLLTCTAPPTSQEGRLWPSRRRGIISGRFRERKLVGSGGYSKCFFAAVFPQAMPAAHARFRGRFVAGSARGTP